MISTTEKEEAMNDTHPYSFRELVGILECLADSGTLQRDSADTSRLLIYRTDMDKKTYGTTEGWCSQNIFDVAQELFEDEKARASFFEEMRKAGASLPSAKPEEREEGRTVFIPSSLEDWLTAMFHSELSYWVCETQYPVEYATEIFASIGLLRQLGYDLMAADYDIAFEKALREEDGEDYQEEAKETLAELLQQREAYHKIRAGEILNSGYENFSQFHDFYSEGKYREAAGVLQDGMEVLNLDASVFYQRKEYFKDEIRATEEMLSALTFYLTQLKEKVPEAFEAPPKMDKEEQKR